jgi:hypothetical protein
MTTKPILVAIQWPCVLTEGDRNRFRPSHGHLGVCRSIIRPTFPSFCVLSYVMCEDFVCFEQSMPYTWKNVGSFLRALKFTMPLMKIIVCWILRLNLLEDPNTIPITFINLNLPLI